MKNKFKKYILSFVPPIFLKIYRKIKYKYNPPSHKIYFRTSSQIVTERQISLNEMIISENKIDKVRIESYMEWINPFSENDSRKYQYKELTISVGDNKEIVLGFNNYGAWTICINYLRGDICVEKEIKTINVEAPEYNIGFLAATLPVEIFLTKLWDITSVDTPTIIGLERVLINYENLPENVFPFPLATKEELYTPYKGFNSYSQRLVSYTGALYRLNPNVRFNLYLCDHQAYYSLALMYANGIPEKNFKVFLLSDGISTYQGFDKIFNCPEADKTYNMMRTTWILSKQKALESGIQKWKKETFVKCGNPCVSQEKRIKDNITDLSNRVAYAYVLANENPNYTWIMHNPKLLKYSNKQLNPIPSSICKVDFVNDIKLLEKHKAELIKMFDMKCSVFDRSFQHNKKICLLLSSYPPSANDEKYIAKLTDFFGKEYDYYFKEHPWASQDKKRMQMIEDQGISLLDPKIPTEFYLMINPDIYIAGYVSALFLSIDLLRNPSEQLLSIFNSKGCRIKTECLDFTAKTAMNIEDNTVVVYK